MTSIRDWPTTKTTYAVVDATFSGLAFRDDEPDWESLLGPEGRAQVRLHPSLDTTAWVNDCGLLLPETYARNVVGSCLLLAMGARPQPYAGPVVLTGWDHAAEGLGPEVRSLAMPAMSLLSLHRRVRAAVDGTARPNSLAERDWARSMRDFADYVRGAPAPHLTLTPVPVTSMGRTDR
ncbi:hypothetical protein OG393_30730 [Streptomyces sp. NBC_01216]|uniref:hypothetical protein n=1 Tax=Streptomyces sp. NBC_01216 TaxID=2903778 RepID=UPI002E0E29F1|nr:hypothetical protein OG393_30730 [Streptomyces sp. NBC_01216]